MSSKKKREKKLKQKRRQHNSFRKIKNHIILLKQQLETNPVTELIKLTFGTLLN